MLIDAAAGRMIYRNHTENRCPPLSQKEETNMKLTYKEDTYIMDKFFQLRNSEVEHSDL